MRFLNKVALVTGGGSGMGEAISRGFAKEGADIAIFDLNIENAEMVANVVRGLGRRAVALKVDIANFAEVNACVKTVLDELQHIDILVNAAGYGQYVPFAELSEDVWDRSVAVHLKGTFNCTRAVINEMIAQRSGKIVNISSTAGIIGSPRHTHYSAAKAGVIGMSKALAKEVAAYGINVNVIAPGPTDTPFLDEMKKEAPDKLEQVTKSIPMGRRGTAEDMAMATLFLASEDAAYITGQILSPNGGKVI